MNPVLGIPLCATSIVKGGKQGLVSGASVIDSWFLL